MTNNDVPREWLDQLRLFEQQGWKPNQVAALVGHQWQGDPEGKNMSLLDRAVYYAVLLDLLKGNRFSQVLEVMIRTPAGLAAATAATPLRPMAFSDEQVDFALALHFALVVLKCRRSKVLEIFGFAEGTEGPSLRAIFDQSSKRMPLANAILCLEDIQRAALSLRKSHVTIVSSDDQVQDAQRQFCDVANTMVLKGIDLDQIETAVRWAVGKQLTSERRAAQAAPVASVFFAPPETLRGVTTTLESLVPRGTIAHHMEFYRERPQHLPSLIREALLRHSVFGTLPACGPVVSGHGGRPESVPDPAGRVEVHDGGPCCARNTVRKSHDLQPSQVSACGTPGCGRPGAVHAS